MKDSRMRSIAKGLVWRVIATGTTMSLVYLGTGDLELTAHVGLADVVIKLIFYYGHERAWGRVAWGKVPVAIDR
jgi:adenylylsulfate kinase